MVWNRTAEKTAPLVERGAEAAPSPGEAAARAAIVITFLADDNALEEVALGPEGIAARLGPGGVHLSSMSAISPALARRLAAAHREQDAGYVAAPVFGRPDAAAAGQAWIVTSGAAAAKAKAHPILEALGQGVHDLGEDPAAAHIVKLAGNFLIAAATEAMAEAYTLGEKCGLDRMQLAEFFGASLFPSRIYQHWCPVGIGGWPRPACTKRSRSSDSRPHEFSSCVCPPRSLAFGRIRVTARRHISCSPRSMAGLPRASIQPT